jgi:hypothetical protein
MNKVDLGPDIILFGSLKCPACLSQLKLLHTYYTSKGKKLNFMYYDLDSKKPPKYIVDSKGDYSMPSWYSPHNKKIIIGLIPPEKFEKTINPHSNAFGSVPEIDSLVKYGKTFGPSGTNFNIKGSWDNKLSKKWNGDPMRSGMMGRELGPTSKVGDVLSKEYYYAPRMANPGSGDLATFLTMNQRCNTLGNPNAELNNVGLFYDSKYQSSFGKKRPNIKRSNFGGLYSQMGPAYERGNQYLVSKNTIANLYGGAVQNEPNRPNKVQNNELYISKNVEAYNPIKRSQTINKFGIGEGSVLKIGKNGKIKKLN